MDVRQFYGGSTSAVQNIPDGNISEDHDISDEDTTATPSCSNTTIIYASESEDDSEISLPNQSANVVPETDSDSEDDNIPLIKRIADAGGRHKSKLGGKRNENEVKWKEGNLILPPSATNFFGNCTLPQEVMDLSSPLQYFRFFFTKEILEFITYETNLYSVQCRPNKSAAVTVEEMEQFIGICLYMSIIQLPATRHYWCSYLGHPVVYEVMTCNRWEEIKRFIHFCDNTALVPQGQPGHDKLFKVRPLLEKLRDRLLLIPKEEFLAVDEQIIPTKSRSSIKQYNPKKPHKWGYKAFVLSGVSGFSYDYEVFAGSQSNTFPPGAPDLGASSNVVVRLVQTVPRHVNHKIFFDNWFTSVPLEVYLHKEGLLSLGTVRINRVPGSKMPKVSEMKKKGRGSMTEKVAIVEGVHLSVVSWFDNKLVNTLSTYCGSKPEGERKRLFRKENIHKMIPCPHSVMIYNDYMGGVDLLDSMLGYYRIQIRSKKWYLKIFFHMLDLACVNSWLLWRRNYPDYMPLVDFKVAVADALCNAGKVQERKRGRPSSNIQKEIDAKKRRGPTTEIPQAKVRQDGINHVPIWLEKRGRCKLPDCPGRSFTACQKCNVELCLNKDRNCFKIFHEC